MYMVMFVLDDSSHLDDVIQAWQEIGVTGVTLMESTGAYRHQMLTHLGARHLFALPRMVDAGRASHTLFTIVPDRTVVEQCAAAVERIVGSLDQPDTGVLAAWELDVVRGVPDRLRGAGQQDKESPA